MEWGKVTSECHDLQTSSDAGLKCFIYSTDEPSWQSVGQRPRKAVAPCCTSDVSWHGTLFVHDQMKYDVSVGAMVEDSTTFSRMGKHRLKGV